MNSKKQIIEQLNRNIQKLQTEFTVRRIGLFGSFAADNADENSDVDILVELKDPTFDHYMDLKFYLEKLFERNVDLVLKDTLKPRVKPIIQQEVIYAEGL